MNTQVAVLTQETQLIVVYDGPRGLPGREGNPGLPGTPGRSITVLGDWNNQLLYAPGNAVTSRSLLSPSLTALWIVRDGGQPTVGRAPHLDPSEWSEVSAGGEGGAGAVYRVAQLGHPFTTVGQPVARSERTGRYELADARDVDLLAIGVVAEVPSLDEFAVQVSGRLVNAGPLLIFDPAAPAGRGSSDWILGRVYYLSTVPGMYEAATPSQPGAYFLPMVVPVSPTELVLLTWGPENLQTPVDIPAVDIGAGIIPGREGQLWYRRQDRPGLYVALWDATRTRLMWVMANG
jgi:hypothetical protein